MSIRFIGKEKTYVVVVYMMVIFVTLEYVMEVSFSVECSWDSRGYDSIVV